MRVEVEYLGHDMYMRKGKLFYEHKFVHIPTGLEFTSTSTKKQTVDKAWLSAIAYVNSDKFAARVENYNEVMDRENPDYEDDRLRRIGLTGPPVPNVPINVTT